MADPQQANALPECPTEGGATAEEQDMSLRPETSPTSSPTCEESVSGRSPAEPQPPGLLSMPCLLKELRRDSSPEQHLETVPASTAAQLRPQEDSDSSICLRSPSSSGHLGDSDTLSSAEEAAEPTPATAAGGRKSSRRSRSESDASGAAMAAKKNRCQEKQVNGRGRGRGPRSQRQKERMRLLRQKREAAARRKPDLLQDSSTSDSDITAHSSSSSSSSASSDEEGATVNSHPPAGRRGNEASRTTAQGLLDGGVASGSLGGVLEEALTRFATMQRQTEERFRVWMERLTRLHSDDDNDQSSSENPEGRSNVSSFLPSSESQETLAAYQIARLNANPLPHTQANGLNGILDSPDPNLLNV
ncbi:protein ARK2N isoform X1 [Brachyhypopomus gauderio]|uniref:protein ARK2N isoform X1 n=1 Tax=Brachyhypopomus gauderio TaxID=698409 RepID=UPI0040429B7F